MTSHNSSRHMSERHKHEEAYERGLHAVALEDFDKNEKIQAEIMRKAMAAEKQRIAERPKLEAEIKADLYTKITRSINEILERYDAELLTRDTIPNAEPLLPYNRLHNYFLQIRIIMRTATTEFIQNVGPLYDRDERGLMLESAGAMQLDNKDLIRRNIMMIMNPEERGREEDGTKRVMQASDEELAGLSVIYGHDRIGDEGWEAEGSSHWGSQEDIETSNTSDPSKKEEKGKERKDEDSEDHNKYRSYRDDDDDGNSNSNDDEESEVSSSIG